MKEGYLQLKISELNDKCTKIDQMISMEKSKIELLEEKVGGLKELIKKLKDLEEFKEHILKQIQVDNQKIIEDEIKSVSKKIEKNIDLLLKDKTKELDKILDYMRNREKTINQQNEMILQNNNKLNYLLKHNNFLMMKLVNKGILSDREVNELDIRSQKNNNKF
ncbi:hypothetical protein AYK20_04605 [Thermoplasmatales archaeon SG8-52-1]|nr:MAG: hypothetical protein AYK20_04605 [Thermoplasmatales archaeon SG8-52-1]